MAPAPPDPVVVGTLRQAVPGDAPRLAAVDSRTSSTPQSEASYVAWCRGEGVERVLVAENAGDVTGFLVYACVLDEGSIYNIAVDPVWRGRGTGRFLLLAVLDIMRSGGIQTCLLEVRESNVAARRLYDSLGFRVDGRRRGYYPADGGREDALLMSMAL